MFGLADIMRDALQRAGAVDIIRMTSCMQKWLTDRKSIVRAVDPPDPGKQHNGKRSALESGASAAKRQRYNKAAASASPEGVAVHMIEEGKRSATKHFQKEDETTTLRS